MSRACALLYACNKAACYSIDFRGEKDLRIAQVSLAANSYTAFVLSPDFTATD